MADLREIALDCLKGVLEKKHDCSAWKESEKEEDMEDDLDALDQNEEE